MKTCLKIKIQLQQAETITKPAKSMFQIQTVV